MRGALFKTLLLIAVTLSASRQKSPEREHSYI
jgi:hypothetical protein